MAPVVQDLEKRQYYCNSYSYSYGDNGCYYSPWNSYGRWILLAVIVVVAFLLFLSFSCITARRRRRRGMQPFPMTGWAYRQNQPYNYGQQQNYNQGGYNAPPAYSGQQYGVAQPQPVYNNNSRDAGAGHYAPPSGPPPGKK